MLSADPVADLIARIAATRQGCLVKVRNKRPAICILVKVPGQKRGRVVACLLE